MFVLLPCDADSGLMYALPISDLGLFGHPHRNLGLAMGSFPVVLSNVQIRMFWG